MAKNTSQRLFFNDQKYDVDLPNLIGPQLASYKWFLEKGLKELFEEHYPIVDWTETEYRLEFVDYRIDEPKTDEREARARNITYEAPVRIKVRLINNARNKKQVQEVFVGDIPLMTERGTFIINGIERVIISQILRSPGAFFSKLVDKEDKQYFGAKLIPNRGAWLEIETDAHGVLWVKIDRKRKVPLTSLLRAFGLAKDADLIKTFSDVDTGDVKFIKETIKKDIANDQLSGFAEVYRRIRPGDLASDENAKQLIESMFFNFNRYDLGKVGRYKMNIRLGMKAEDSKENRILRIEDLVAAIKEIIRLNNTPGAEPDDIDNLSNRRVRLIGELVQERARIGLARMEKIVKDRMSTADPHTITPVSVINARPLVATIHEFFASSQLSQYMDQVNTLAELEHKRRISALGPNGLTRDRAGFEVRDVHPTHFGRICPIQTPEGPNIGLIGHLAVYAHINQYGFLETPFRKVVKGKVTDEVVNMDSNTEKGCLIGSALVKIDKEGNILDKVVTARQDGEVKFVSPKELDYINASAKQLISVSTALIPFVEHDDSARALMGSNMQRQAVACIKPDSPVVGTGMEEYAARYSGQVVYSPFDGVVEEVDGSHVIVVDNKTKKQFRYDLVKFLKSNSYTSINQKIKVSLGAKVKKGDILVDGANIQDGELALGQNLLVGFMSWEGNNYEDAIIVSERLVKDDVFTSIHIEDFVIDVSDTRLGPEVVTRDIPNISEDKLKDLDVEGIIRIGASVKQGDILVGKISPKGETELTAEERLLRVIFGEKSREVKDTSLRLPNGHRGKVVDVKIFTRENGDKLPSGVLKRVQVSIAHTRQVMVGDKLAGRHGNKGVIARVLPVEDMPFDASGRPLDVMLTPLGIASRMNLGQILETHLGIAADQMGVKVASPSLNGVSFPEIQELLKEANLDPSGKRQLYDGRTGEPFLEQTTVGIIYIMKLIHLVEDKLHMRSTGPYSLITQQPLGGKAQMGGQRLGEMEVWAFEGYGAAYTLQEMLTVKSDDVLGRSKAYESIIKGERIQAPYIPSSFHVLVNELKGLGINVELINPRTASPRPGRFDNENSNGQANIQVSAEDLLS
jgi:DNA-directed RNA polymerase subunit beta